MKVQMKADISGTRDGTDWPPRGERVDLPDEEAAALCAAGLAEPLAELTADVETTADNRPTQKRRGRPPKNKAEPAEPDSGDAEGDTTLDG